MKKNSIIKIFIPGIFSVFLLLANFSSAATNVNYGTTTFFTQEKDKNPPVSTPILDYNVSNKRKKTSDVDKVKDPSLFDQVIGSVKSLFGSSANDPSADSSRNDSLFDYQNSNDQFFSDYSSGEYIMGPRGESYENLDEDEAARYKSRFAQSFNFRDAVKDAAPKKSKLLFTNVEINVDLTTQYVILGLVFFTAIGLSVGYYLWKKESRLENRKYNADDEL